MNRSIISLAALAVFLVIGGSAKAGQLTIPNSFSSGATASASAVNANFTAVKAAVDDNNSRINTNISGISSNSSALGGKLSTSGGTMTGNLTVPNIYYSGTKTRYLNIPPSSFQPQNGTTYNYSNANNYLYGTGNGNSYYFYAPVNLPSNATVTLVEVFTYDNLGLGLVKFDMYLISVTSASYYTQATDTGSAGSAPGNETLTDNSITYPTLCGGNTSYNCVLRVYLNYTWGSFLRVYGARITYTVDAPE